MNRPSTIWRFVIILLSFSTKFCPLVPAGSQSFNGLGDLTVEPAPPFLIGSNLTVYCHISKCQTRLKMSLELNGVTVNSWRKINCTTVKFNLPSVQMPQSIVLCKLQSDQSKIVGGLDLYGGLPPGKPDNIICETTRSSDIITCSWERGQETYLHTTYNVSITREIGTQIYFDHIQDAEELIIPRGILDDNTTYKLTIVAYNHFGASQSDPFILCINDTVTPEIPHIWQVEFTNSSCGATLQWTSTESSLHLRPYIRLRAHNVPWEVREGTEISEGMIRVDDLRPLTEYEFQMRTCKSTSGLTHTNMLSSTCTTRSLCSKWSSCVRRKSPGKAPSQPLHVWRKLGSNGTSGLQITVLWKPPPSDDYSGDLQHYKIFLANDQKQIVTCAANLCHCPVLVPEEVHALSISAFTTYGTSPPEDVPFRTSGGFSPDLIDLTPAANGSAVHISWMWLGTKHWSTSGGDLLHYVIEWTSVPEAEHEWQKLAKDQNSTYISGLTAGVRYNISLYAVTTRGVSAPSSRLMYSKQQKPVSGPKISVLVHEAMRILIVWDELPVNQQRGFITKYTIYIQTLDFSSPELIVTVSGSGPRQMWLDCPEGALALQLTASTSAGEGPRTSLISSRPATPAGYSLVAIPWPCYTTNINLLTGLVIVIVFIVTLFIAIIANLMCWSCVRKRIKQKCKSWGPAWLVENLPKPGNSKAIRLLEDGNEPSFTCTHSDPPLSPISLISWEEREDVYPTIHVEESQLDSGRRTVETPLLTSHSGTMPVDCQLEHVNYKPQFTTLALQEEEAEAEQKGVSAGVEEGGRSGVFGGLLGGLLSSVDMDFSDSPLGVPLSSVAGLLWPKTSPVSKRGVLQGRRLTENGADSAFLELPQGEITPNESETCMSAYTVGTMLHYGYFPQVAAVSSTTLSETQR
ncbi:interleukin-23 receptor isoform X2 [Channa argus]|uniref:interleukin-23 receptor isoform X2 n=1 Tax=Channa argus TaxID=215402 RepID=UPI003521F4CC